jgi:hypothetical protein
MNPIQELKQACKKHRIQDVTFICRNLMQFDDWATGKYAEWEAVIPFNACFSHCRGTGPTKQLAKESCALQALPICQGFITDSMYNPMIKLTISGGNKIAGSRNRTPFICVPKFNVPIEHCAATAFNVSYAIRRCKENLDTMLSTVNESFDDVLHKQSIDDSGDEENEEESEDEKNDDQKPKNDINGKIITVTDDMIKHWQAISYCKNCKCDNCAMKRPQRVKKPEEEKYDQKATHPNDANGKVTILNVLGKKYKCEEINE